MPFEQRFYMAVAELKVGEVGEIEFAMVLINSVLPHVENRSKEQRKTFNDQTTLTITLTVSVTRVNFACHSHSLTSCTKSSSQRKDCYDRIEKKASVNKSRLTQLSEINVKGRKCSTFIKLRFYLKIAMP